MTNIRVVRRTAVSADSQRYLTMRSHLAVSRVLQLMNLFNSVTRRHAAVGGDMAVRQRWNFILWWTRMSGMSDLDVCTL